MTLNAGHARSLVPLAGLLLALVGAACHRAPSAGATGSAPTPREPVRVSVVSPQQRELPRYVRATGTLFGDEETTIAAKVAGRVAEIARDMGDTAAPGDILLSLDPTDYALARDERQQAFREVLASIGLQAMPAAAADFSVDSLPAVQSADLQARNARARYERGKVLAERDPPLISQQEFADLKTTWEVAESNLRVQRLEAEARLAEARTLEAQVRVAQQRVTDAVHRAPGAISAEAPAPASAPRDSAAAAPSGERVYEVARRHVSVGDYVQVGAPLFNLVDPDPLKLRASVPERRLGVIKVGQTAAVTVESLKKSFPGVVSRVSPAVDVLTRSFTVEILVPNPDRQLHPGSFAIAEILVGSERAMVVPSAAVVTFAGVHKVVAVVKDAAQEKRVELGQREGDLVEITRGLADSDRLILRPPASLTTGAPVVIGEPPTTPPPPAPAPPAPPATQPRTDRAP